MRAVRGLIRLHGRIRARPSLRLNQARQRKQPGRHANDGSLSWKPALSADGRYIAFESSASTLVSGDTNSHTDVFVHDRTTGETTRESVSGGGAQANKGSGGAAVSADGRFVSFASDATNLVHRFDTNKARDIFIRDRVSGKTSLRQRRPALNEPECSAPSGPESQPTQHILLSMFYAAPKPALLDPLHEVFAVHRLVNSSA